MMQRPGRASIVKKKRGSRDGVIGAFGPAEESRSRLDWSSASGVLVWFVANAPSVRCRACWSVDVRQASSMSRADRERWACNRHAAQKHHVGASKKESSSRPNRARRMNAKGQLCPSATGQKAKLDFWLGSRYPATEATCAERERERGSFPLELGWKCEELQLQHRSPRAKG